MSKYFLEKYKILLPSIYYVLNIIILFIFKPSYNLIKKITFFSEKIVHIENCIYIIFSNVVDSLNNSIL